MKKRILSFVILLCLVVTAGFYLLQKPQKVSTQETQDNASADVSEIKDPQPELASTTPELQKQPEIVEKQDEEVSKKQVIAMRQMVAAHKSLREPNVADPDSKENKEILQSMVLKALNDKKATEATLNN